MSNQWADITVTLYVNLDSGEVRYEPGFPFMGAGEYGFGHIWKDEDGLPALSDPVDAKDREEFGRRTWSVVREPDGWQPLNEDEGVRFGSGS